MQANITAKLKFQTLKQAVFEITFITGNIKTIIVDLHNEVEYIGKYKEHNTTFFVYLKKQGPQALPDEPQIEGLFYCDIDKNYNYKIVLYYFPQTRMYQGFIVFVPTKEAAEKI